MPSKPHTLEFTGNTAALPRLFADIDDMLGVLYKRITTAEVAVDLATEVTGILPVANGGTAGVSHTAYAVLTGGTTSTDAIQSVSGVGTTGQVLTSNDAGFLPTWQDAAGGISAAQVMQRVVLGI